VGRNGRRRLIVCVFATGLVATACTGSGGTGRSDRELPVVSPASSAAPRTTSAAPTTSHANTTRPAPATKRTPAPASASSATPTTSALPLHFSTGAATQVITVTAASTSSTEATLQEWRKVGSGWRKFGSASHAWVGSDGLSTQPSETRSATPIGTFTLTRAFGRNADPGTGLPYTRTTPADWWISQAGPLYNTMQRCSSDCAFTQGDPNEHLYYTVPYYRYAVVIDYNTRNAPGGVTQGAGSAFFLHVTVGEPTQGCVSISEDKLIELMRWLSPARHPRILIGLR
jgi:L,D-peptidoglycan transpeptidase YkuD (ErfK/YbiS/YcfS/YnhG family)